MPQIDMGATFSTHRFKLCSKCDTDKPPEGGIENGHKWICQSCWLKKITGVHLKQNRIDGGKRG
jgi:hypothetical protein